MSHPEGERATRPNAIQLARALTAGAALSLALSLFDSHPPRPTLGRRTPVTDPAPSRAKPEFKPAGTFTPDKNHLNCDREERTIQPGDTVYGLTTVGLDSDPADGMKDMIYTANLQYIAKQAETDPGLRNPNSIRVGQKIKILDNCVWIGRVIENTWSAKIPTYFRWASYESFAGDDGRLHHEVEIAYTTDLQGHFDAIEICNPSPDCYSYIAGAPKPPTP